jgi:hypothetical protein
MKERKTRAKTLKALVTLLMQSKEEKGYLELVSLDRRRHGPLDEQLVFTVWLQIRDQSSLSQPQLE